MENRVAQIYRRQKAVFTACSHNFILPQAARAYQRAANVILQEEDGDGR
jgi:hypothetical protein